MTRLLSILTALLLLAMPAVSGGALASPEPGCTAHACCGADCNCSIEQDAPTTPLHEAALPPSVPDTCTPPALLAHPAVEPSARPNWRTFAATATGRPMPTRATLCVWTT